MATNVIVVCMLIAMYAVLILRAQFILDRRMPFTVSAPLAGIAFAIMFIAFGMVGIFATEHSLFDIIMTICMFSFAIACPLIAWKNVRKYRETCKNKETDYVLPQGSYRVYHETGPIIAPNALFLPKAKWFLEYKGHEYILINAPKFSETESPEISVTLWPNNGIRINYPFVFGDIIELLLIVLCAISPVFAAKALSGGGFRSGDPAFPYKNAFPYVAVWCFLLLCYSIRRSTFTQKDITYHKIYKYLLIVFEVFAVIGLIVQTIENFQYFIRG